MICCPADMVMKNMEAAGRYLRMTPTRMHPDMHQGKVLAGRPYHTKIDGLRRLS